MPKDSVTSAGHASSQRREASSKTGKVNQGAHKSCSLNIRLLTRCWMNSESDGSAEEDAEFPVLLDLAGDDGGEG